MKRVMITVSLAMVLAFSATGAGWAAEPPVMEKPLAGLQVVCPVRGGKINKDIYVDYKGQRIYFCCPGCPDIFKKDPERYLQQMREQGIVPEPSPAGR
jgi:YHS domain-containing protein